MRQNKSIYVTKSFLPPIQEYTKYLNRIWDSHVLTNQGPLLCELESSLKEQLSVKNIQVVSNGTVALNIALRALDISDGEIITTPFSFVATTTSILWERCSPVFVDINKDDFCIDVSKIEKAITKKTRAIMAVHVFGYPCDVEAIEKIATKHNIRVIYDGAHAFGSVYKGKSLLSYGDITTCSFHATKLFHTVEGGACLAKDDKINQKLDLIKRFGYNQDDYICVGTNAKNSEVHAAMGLAILDHIKEIIRDRKRVSEQYDKLLSPRLIRPYRKAKLEYNYAYYPVVFKSEQELLRVFSALAKDNIFSRRYFYPSLNTLDYIEQKGQCATSEDISSRIACLPLYVGLENNDIKKICKIINRELDI